MSFILLHHENSFCAHEACLINVSQIASVLPISGFGKIYAEQSKSTVYLTDGKELRVTETLETVMGMLRSIDGFGHIEGAGPQLIKAEGEDVKPEVTAPQPVKFRTNKYIKSSPPAQVEAAAERT